MGAFVGALFVRNTNKTNNKQHVNRGYDSESAANTTALKLMNDLLQNAHVSLVQYPFIPPHF